MKKKALIEWNGATLTVAPATIRSEIVKNQLYWRLLDANAESAIAFQFAQLAAVTTVTGGDLEWQPPESLTPEAIQESFAAWCEMPGELYHKWVNVFNALNEPTAPEELREEFDPESADPEV